MKSGKGVKSALFGLVGFIGLIWFFYVGVMAQHVTRSMRTTVSSTEAFENWKLIHRDRNLNYVSKRRVPNGPDPIHNRRAFQSRQPPGQY